MGTETGNLIKCRGCKAGDFVPLKRKAKAGGPGRFYYVHPKRKVGGGCGHMEDFDGDIDQVSDLKALVPDLSLKLKETSDTPTAAVEPLREQIVNEPPPKPLKETPPTTDEPKTKERTFGQLPWTFN